MAIPNPLKEYPPEVQIFLYGEAFALLTLLGPGTQALTYPSFVSVAVLAIIVAAARRLL